MGEHDTFRLAGRAARRDDERVAVVDRFVEAHRVEQRFDRRARQARIDRQRGVAVVPGAAERVDEARSAGSVDGDEAPHGDNIA